MLKEKINNLEKALKCYSHLLRPYYSHLQLTKKPFKPIEKRTRHIGTT